jgi:tRNA (guanine-N7-)-methyltransferase
MSLPLHLDIGCGKGGFLLELAAERPGKNYLGLEIRPSVAEFAQERVAKRNLTGTLGFVGCNANVDLDRLLTRWDEAGGGPIQMVTIQFPDPHFKNQHAKRRVVTDQLVQTLAKFMEPASAVFLQSDVQELLDDMRLKFRELDNYFEDLVPELDQYMQDNYIGTPTEREISVLKRDLPVFRTLFHRTMKPFARYKEYYGVE